MKFRLNNQDLFIPDHEAEANALERTTHLGVGAHQDDLEFMALHGILECFQRADQWFGGVTCTDGGGSARSGPYANYTDSEMKRVRVHEQKVAATIGQYSFMAQLGHPSTTAKAPTQRQPLVDDLETLLLFTRPQAVYTHQPFDKHATHIGVLIALLEAIRRLPQNERPQQLFGCEVWRGLDWLPDHLKVIQPVDAHPNLAAALAGVFDSQIAGGKRYDLAVEGRHCANATYFDSHSVDACQRAAYAIDLTPLIQDDTLTVEVFISEILEQFTDEVTSLLGQITH
ncbi:PIG-L deacetylase family protein [Cerasicoccus arenae]|uniref:PIG-L family deacetylase n=1 Tax=Cerasicoccus arenae TaxID=424488 RepID=A0A8J3D9M0_9BACT|nr:PIG-L family deacetylase [Cerasicoccus arenae]MBK1857057.1 PIG-L family deacetylase [Cerasicoccus arenae]GHB92112.1 hypothetical protein GCM10007047_03910 [Cerasicoccus arenae]